MEPIKAVPMAVMVETRLALLEERVERLLVMGEKLEAFQAEMRRAIATLTSVDGKLTTRVFLVEWKTRAWSVAFGGAGGGVVLIGKSIFDAMGG